MKALKDTLFAAEAFALQLPDSLAQPHLTHEDDGDIAFEWYVDQRCLITVAVRPGHINWAGMYDGESFHDHAKDLTSELLARIKQIAARMQPVSENCND